jgi:hypothetical protein
VEGVDKYPDGTQYMVFTDVNFDQMSENHKKYQDRFDIVYAWISD